MLGKCAKQAEYSYADIIKSLWMIAFTGGQALEDINNQTGSVLKLRPGAHVPNADTIGYAQKKLADKDFTVKTATRTYNCNRNIKLCNLIIRIILTLNMLRENKEYDFDFDNQLIPTEKFDATYFENGWLTYNPYQYDDENVDGIRTLSKATTHASGTIPFQYNTCTSISLDYAPYSLGIIKEFDDKISLYLTNYEGGKDVITIHGATSKPTFTQKI